MPINSIIDSNISLPINPDLKLRFPLDKDPTWYQKIIATKCFKHIKVILSIIYLLNMIGWGTMLVFITIGVANKTMSDERTRKIWIEIDSQILNVLVCIISIGLIPWRVRDLYELYNQKHRHKLLRRHSYTDNFIWLQIIIWAFIANSLFQIGMAVCMWSTNMYTRPTWLVGLFGGLAGFSGIFASLTQFILRKKTKKKTRLEQEQTNIF